MGSTPTDPDFLALWEAGAGQHPLDRAIGFISEMEGITRSEAAGYSLDARDRALFRICAARFGPRIELLATCGECGAESEIDIEVSDVLAIAPPSERIMLERGGATISCRLPDSRDLADALASPTPRETLLVGLIKGTEPDAGLLAAVEELLASRSGLAGLTLANDCPECEAVTETPFDILDYLWRRITAEAQRLLRDVHVLARAYGWSSSEILALTPQRRAAHIAMVEA